MDSVQFEKFCKRVQEEIIDYIPNEDTAEAILRKIVKNNGVTLTALQIVKENQNCTPSIYLEEYYERYESGEDWEEILQQIVMFYLAHEHDMNLSAEDISSFEQMKDKIIFRLINFDMNKKQLEDCPYFLWNDLAITFRWLAHHDELGIASALVTNREMNMWKVDKETLYNIAMKNMPQYFPAVCEKMESILLESIEEEEERERLRNELFSHDQEQRIHMLVLTNEQKINGACSVIYEGMLKRVAVQCEADLYLLPSSVHEMIVIPQKFGISSDELKQMVWDANTSVVSNGELLSNHIYYYNREKDSVCMM